MAPRPASTAPHRQLASVALVLLVLGVVAALSHESSGGGPAADEETVAVSERFLEEYVDLDGRVVRHDEGGTTVSEGQAYGLLVAVGVGDRDRFDAILDWTDENLRRDDGLLAWHWDDGEVDPAVATDADLDAIHALLVAAERFDEPSYRDRARRMAAAVDQQLVAEVGDELLLLPGEWAQGPPFRWNPSYVSPMALDLLDEHAADEGRWRQLRDASYGQVERSLDGGADLPPDWAEVSPDGDVQPDDAEDLPVFGFDAARVPVRMAVACDERGREVADRVHDFLSRQERPVAVYDLEGSEQVDFQHPLMLVAAAAGEHAAGRPDRVDDLLLEAAELDREHPTYYGAAWVALGRLLLTTDLLHRCE